MTLLHYFAEAVVLFGILCAGLFLAACAVFIGLWGHGKWIERGRS